MAPHTLVKTQSTSEGRPNSEQFALSRNPKFMLTQLRILTGLSIHGCFKYMLVAYIFFAFKVKIDPRTFFDNDVSTIKNRNLRTLAKAGTKVDKSE